MTIFVNVTIATMDLPVTCYAQIIVRRVKLTVKRERESASVVFQAGEDSTVRRKDVLVN